MQSKLLGLSPDPLSHVRLKDIPMYNGGGGPAFPQNSLVQQGTYDNSGGTKQDGKPVNVVRRGQRATLNGKPVVADGNGNWLDASDSSKPMSERSKAGSYESGNRSEPKTGPTPQAPKRPGVGAASLSIPPSAAQPGKGPKGNEVGSDSDPDEPGLQGPGDPKGPPGARVNENGLRQYGKTLGGLNEFTKAMTGYEIADVKTAFKSEDLPGAYETGSNTISTGETPYALPQGSTPSNVGGKYSMDGVDTSIRDTPYEVVPASVPGTIGKNTADPQSGASDKPDIAEEVRTIRMNRNAGRGSRRDPRNRGEDPDMFSAPEPSDASLVSPMYKNSKRNEIRSTFLDFEGPSTRAAMAANAKAGFGKDSNANPRFNYGGELVNAKVGMEWKAKNAAMMGEDPSPYLDVPTTPDVQPDTPAASELAPTPASAVKPGSITPQENIGGSLEVTAPITKPSPEKFKETQDFLTSRIDWLNRKK